MTFRRRQSIWCHRKEGAQQAIVSVVTKVLIDKVRGLQPDQAITHALKTTHLQLNQKRELEHQILSSVELQQGE